MPKPRFIGQQASLDRQTWLLQLDAISAPFAWDELGKSRFVCLCAVNAKSIPDDEIRRFCSHLIDLGCAYFCAWGPDCERVHDIMDRQVIGDNPPATYIGCLMTTWHATEPLTEAVDFFRTCTVPDEDYAPAGCSLSLAIVVGSPNWTATIEQRLRQS
jgi:hypothetical protein